MAQPQNPKTVKNEIERDVAELKHVRDEIRLKLHLASMDAQSAWRDLEKQLERLEEQLGYAGDHMVQTSRDLAVELKQSFRDFKKLLN
jgi:hypothetical protein